MSVQGSIVTQLSAEHVGVAKIPRIRTDPSPLVVDKEFKGSDPGEVEGGGGGGETESAVAGVYD